MNFHFFNVIIQYYTSTKNITAASHTFLENAHNNSQWKTFLTSQKIPSMSSDQLSRWKLFELKTSSITFARWKYQCMVVIELPWTIDFIINYTYDFSTLLEFSLSLEYFPSKKFRKKILYKNSKYFENSKTYTKTDKILWVFERGCYPWPPEYFCQKQFQKYIFKIKIQNISIPESVK